MNTFLINSTQYIGLHCLLDSLIFVINSVPCYIGNAGSVQQSDLFFSFLRNIQSVSALFEYVAIGQVFTTVISVKLIKLEVYEYSYYWWVRLYRHSFNQAT